MLQIQDRVKETSASTGVGVFALAGAMVGYKAFSAVCSVSDTLYYVIEGVDGSGNPTGEWEVGLGTYSAASQITRTTVLASSNAGLAVNFSSGTKQVWIDIAAAIANDWARLSGASFTAEVGIKATAVNTASLTLGIPSGSATTLHGVNSDLTAPSTDTSALYGFKQALRTAAAAFTLTNMVFFSANTGQIGAGSSVTTSKAFEAVNAIAKGGTNYAFYTDFALASGNWAFYSAGTASSRLFGTLGLGNNGANGATAFIDINNNTGVVVVPWAGTTARGISVGMNGTSTQTVELTGVITSLGTQAAAYTVAALYHFRANSTTGGAGSAATAVYGFAALDAIRNGITNTNTYGFYSTIATASGAYQLYMAGTGESYFGAPVGVLGNTPLSRGSVLDIGAAATHPATVTAGYVVRADTIGPATMTAALVGFSSTLRTTASAYTLTLMTHFEMSVGVKGAGSTVTQMRGFAALNAAIIAGALNIGFYSDIAAGSSIYQLYLGGSADCLIAGRLLMSGARLLLGQGAAVASANNLVLGADGNRFQISGVTQINLIDSTNWQGGATVTLHFQGSLTVKHNQVASGNNAPIMLSGAVDFAATADDQLTLQYDSTAAKWYESGRTVI